MGTTLAVPFVALVILRSGVVSYSVGDDLAKAVVDSIEGGIRDNGPVDQCAVSHGT